MLLGTAFVFSFLFLFFSRVSPVLGGAHSRWAATTMDTLRLH